MLEIKAVEDAADADAAKQLFREYGEFLRDRLGRGDHFNFDKFLGEVDLLPVGYADRRGGVLVAYFDGEAAAIIGYRESHYEGSSSAEFKRLFVRPEFRGHGIGRRMVEEVLSRMKASGFTKVILDTHVEHMAGALKLYRELGFTEYGKRVGSIALLEMDL